MRPRPLGIVWALLIALGYAAALVVVRFVAAAVASASEQVRSTGDVFGGALALDLVAPTVADHLWALIVVDAAVVVLFWGAWRGDATPAASARFGIGAAAWSLLGVGGLLLTAVAATTLLGLEPAWRAVLVDIGAGAVGPGGLPVAAWILLALLHPLAFELLFRGTVTRFVAATGLPGWAVVLLPAALGALAVPSVSFAILAGCVGLVAGALRRRTGRLGVAVTIHYLLVIAGVIIALNGGLMSTSSALIVAVWVGAAASIVGVAFALRATGGKPGAAAERAG
jgi:membrane protease YdiL (CAAX protease family)